MKFQISEMRANAAEFKRQTTADKFVTVRPYRVTRFGGVRYAIISPLKLVDGPQKIEVVNLDKFDNSKLPPAARFALSWPEQGNFLVGDETTDAEIDERVRCNVLLIEPDEGDVHLVTEVGDHRACFWDIETITVTVEK